MSEVLAFLEFRSGERGHLDFERPSKTEALFPRDSVEGNYCVPGWMLEMEICDCLMFHILYSLRVFPLNSSFLIKANNTSPFIEGEHGNTL